MRDETGPITNTTISSKMSLEISEDRKYVRILQKKRGNNIEHICSFPIADVWDYLKDVLASTKYNEASLIRRHNEALSAIKYKENL